MEVFKKTAVVLLAFVLASLMFAVPVGASGLDQFDKSSYSYYLDKNLKATEKTILTFDDMTNQKTGSITSVAKKGKALTNSTSSNNSHLTVVNVPKGSFDFAVTNKFKQTIKMWVYVNDIDLLVCDHDAVYSTPQTGSGTLYITLLTSGSTGHTWQHTFYGSGWHEIELSFLCHNNNYNSLKNINYNHITGLSIWANTKAGLSLTFDEMRLVTYSNPNYKKPTAPHNGRWISTLDYDALDGANLTEWYGSYFDQNDKKQGSSSVAITGHNENVDHRMCIGVNDVQVYYNEDVLCFDLYLSNLSLVGTHWEIRFEHNAQAAHYSASYTQVSTNAVDSLGRPTSLKAGWNHIRIPFKETSVRIGTGYGTFSNDLILTQMMFYVRGTGTTDSQNYIIKYDNMYVAKASDLEKADLALQTSNVASSKPVSSVPVSSEAPVSSEEMSSSQVSEESSIVSSDAGVGSNLSSDTASTAVSSESLSSDTGAKGKNKLSAAAVVMLIASGAVIAAAATVITVVFVKDRKKKDRQS
ncbi:MAG: hypothetical protein IJY56_00190 [Clostridia bacterium]|nr:hypothetical protein [Clostridia bacterium]